MNVLKRALDNFKDESLKSFLSEFQNCGKKTVIGSGNLIVSLLDGTGIEVEIKKSYNKFLEE